MLLYFLIHSLVALNTIRLMALIPYSDFNLSYHRLDIRIAATEDTYFDAWLGAVLRNNLLYAAEQVLIKEGNLSLYKYINAFSLKESHVLYKELKNGFPLPYYLFIHYPLDFSGKELLIKRNEIISFSLVLIGRVAEYFKYFTEALRYMSNRGFGIDMKQFELLDIYEISPKGEKRIIAVTNEDLTQEFVYPVRVTDFINNYTSSSVSLINIEFESPVCLIKSKNKENKIPGFQEKSNAFPSFYQLVRTAVYRFIKLSVLYESSDSFDTVEDMNDRIEEYINDASKLILESAHIKNISLKSTRREGMETRIPLKGYTGNLSFRGKYEKYLPLLQFMQELGVGHELVYGLGKYRVINY